jgi:hypothetical protein
MAEVAGYNVELQPAVLHCDYTYIIRKGAAYQFNLYLNKSPTQNCQLSCIGMMANLLAAATSRDEIHTVLREVFRLVGHTPLLVFCDVRSQWMAKMDEWFGPVAAVAACVTSKPPTLAKPARPTQIVARTPYCSTNDSQMCMYLVKIDNAPR